jgi:DNA-binding transcriptional LysR family regulator
LGARLFDRSQSGYRLTESGESIRAKVDDVEEAVLAVERAASGRDLRATGKVRVATAEDIAAFVIAPKLREFRDAHPGIVLEIVASWNLANLTRREADISLRTSRPLRGDFVLRRVGTWRCALYASKTYCKKHKLGPRQNDLSKVDLISWTEESAFRGGEWLEKEGRGLPLVLAANSRHIQYAACKAGIGAAVLPCLAADRDPELVRLRPSEQVRSVDMWLVAHRDLVRTARVRAVMDFIVQAVNSASSGMHRSTRS